LIHFYKRSIEMKLSLVALARRRTQGFYDPIHSGLGKYTTDYGNLPERYLVRRTSKFKYFAPDGPEYVSKYIKWTMQSHSLERPWSDKYWSENPAFRHPKEYPVVEPIKEADWMWFRGDRVEILKGPDKGKQGYINMIVQERNWVIVEGLNVKYEYVGGSAEFPGMMLKVEQPLLVTTDIKLVDPSDEIAGEVEWRFTEASERVRVSVRSGSIIPVPGKAEETIDYKTKTGYATNKTKDTDPSLVEDITYEPKLATFEMEIMQSMGIEEERIPKKSYWY